MHKIKTWSFDTNFKSRGVLSSKPS